MEFHAILKKLRVKAGKSRYKLAEKSGLNETYLLRLENGERTNSREIWSIILTMALASGLEPANYVRRKGIDTVCGLCPFEKAGAGRVCC